MTMTITNIITITRGYIVGFTDLGNTDEFSTEMLAWRLGHVSWWSLVIGSSDDKL